MAITQVRVQFNGQWYPLAYNEAARAYQVALTPDTFSGSQQGGYYNVTVEATNDSGVVSTADGNTLPGLRLVVRETVPPTLTLVSPAPGYVTDAAPSVILSAADNAGGSGINPDSVAVILDGEAVPADQVAVTAGMGGAYTIVYTSATALPEGPHSVQVSVSDNDGNIATVTAAYIIDTVPPALSASLAFEEVVVDACDVLITGQTCDATAPPVTITIADNGLCAGTAPVAEDGTFAFLLPLEVGENHITVAATDAAGLTTRVSFYIIRLVTDRMQTDVDELNWKGTYNASDLNRVNTAMDYINAWILETGCSSGFQSQGITWTIQSIPVQTQMAAYLANVDALAGVFPLQDAPHLPADMALLTYLGANDIERALVLVDKVRPRMEKSWVYSNEFFCGEV